MSKSSSKRPTKQELRAQQEAQRAQAVEQFETEREARWFRLMASAQKLALALERYPEFSQELSGDEYGYKDLKVDIENDSIEFNAYGLGNITKQSITLDQAEDLARNLDFLEGRFTQFVELRQRRIRQLRTLKRLKVQALRKLTDVEKIALGFYADEARLLPSGPDYYFRDPKSLNAEEVELLEPELEKDSNA